MTSDAADLVRRPPDTPWNVASALDRPSPVRAVSAAGGLVVAAGDTLHMLRPDSQRLRSRDLPPGAEVSVLAAEPWSPFRYAVATRASVEIFTGHRPYGPLLTYSPPNRRAYVTHLAWLRRDGEVALYMRLADGEVVRIRPDSTAVETLDLPPAVAVASDADGMLVALVEEPPDGDGWAWVLSPTEKTWDPRHAYDGSNQKEGLPPCHEHLAVCGRAVAYSTDWLGKDDYIDWCEVSWEPNPEDEYRTFEHPPAVFWGPLAFASETVLFAAYNVEGQVNVLRFQRGRGITRVARLGLDEKWQGDEATVTGLAWDGARKTLWAASPELGLLRMTEPPALS